MSESAETHPVPQSFAEGTHVSNADYKRMYKQSVEQPEQFWAEQAKEFLTWSKDWDQVCQSDFLKGQTAWFAGGELNVTVNCIDRHLPERADQTAIIWEGDDPQDSAHITYAELHKNVCRLANVLKQRGVNKGDRVCIYMPMIPEAAYAMLACVRIGAVHSVVFGGFSPEALKDRILDSDCQTLITADEGVRGGKAVPLKNNCDTAMQGCPNVSTCIVVKRTGAAINMHGERDIWYHHAIEEVSDHCPAEPMDAEAPLFILYTCLLYTSPSPRDQRGSRMPSSA